ncbi:hypothetical protein V6N13_103185 [Hibiscus sabdariffa]|uniref:Uncharacterized protein n=1 Tax=Hibiscus sabdariffa TaxID=183260 RepID=A0ABR2C5G4_9ROSI
MPSKEEGDATVRAAAGAVSTDETNINNNNSHDAIISVEDEDLILSHDDFEKLKSLDKAFEGDQLLEPTAKPLIQRVPSTLRIPKEFAAYFKPSVISIGPIHHGDPALSGSEQLKVRLAAHFVKNIEVEKEKLYNTIKREIGSLKKCYDPKVLEPFDDEKLAWMFFLDGCAILQAILQADVKTTVCSKMNIKNDLLAFVSLDLFLLENQLPHDVLRLLTSSSSGKGRIFMDSIKRFIDYNVFTPAKMVQQQPPPLQELQPEEREAVHILDHLRKRLIFKKQNGGNLEKCNRTFTHMMRSCLDHGVLEKHYSYTVRKVKELRKAGIRLRPSVSSCLMDVSFSGVLTGTLRLTPIEVDDSTGPKFMNLIAYEMCPDFKNDSDVTTYICFLSSLIGNEEDVMELRDAGILYNWLGNDEEVAKLFNKMSANLVPSGTIYSDVILRIQNHCRNVWINFASQAYNLYHDNTFAFLGAIAALVLSSLQTYYTMHPAK